MPFVASIVTGHFHSWYFDMPNTSQCLLIGKDWK